MPSAKRDPASAEMSARPSIDEKPVEANAVGGPAALETIDGRPRDVYDKFTKRQKNLIVAIVSYSAFLARMSSLRIRRKRWVSKLTYVSSPRDSRDILGVSPFDTPDGE